MSVNIDELSVKITSEADSAKSGVDTLIESLTMLKNAVNGVSGLSRTAKGIESISNAVNSINGGAVAKINALANSLKNLSSVGSIGNFSSQIGKISQAVGTLNGTDLTPISRLGTSLQSLSAVSLPNISSIGTGLKNISTAVSSLGSSTSDELDRTAEAIEKVAKASQSFGNVTGTGFATVARTLKSIPDLTEGLNDEAMDKFASACKRVSEAVQPLTSELSSISPAAATMMLKLMSASNVEDSAKRATNLLEDAVASLKEELYALVPGIGTAVSAIKTVTETVQKVVRTIGNVINTVKNVWNSIKNIFNKIKEIFTKIGNVVSKVTSVLAKAFSTTLSAVGKSVSAIWEKVQSLFGGVVKNNLITNFTDLYSAAKSVYSVVERLKSVIWSFIEQSGDYEEMMNMYAVAMGNAAEAGVEYAQVVQDALGIDAAEWMENEAVFMNIVHGFGVASDRAATMSQQLTQIGYDLSSIWNEDVETAMQKLQSGIAGEVEPLRRWGVDLSQARLEQEALTLGIDESVSSMTQAEKAQLRYISIFNQVSEQGVLGDMAKTINSSANQMRVFAAQIELVGRSIGNVLIPIINKVLPYIIALVKAVRSVIDTIAGFFGYSLPTVGDYSVSVGDAVGDLTDDTSDLADATGSAADAAEDYKNTILGIDELNVLNDTTSSSSGGSGGGSGGSGGGGLGDWDFDIPTYDFLDKLVEQNVDNILASFKKLDDFDWVGLRTKIHSAMTKIAKAFNKLADGIPFETIGNFGAEAFNTLNQALNTFWWETNRIGDDGLTTWQRLGRNIAKGVKKIVTTVDWTAFGMTFKNKMHSVLDVLGAAVDEFARKTGGGASGFEKVGIAIADYLEAAFSYDKKGKSFFEKAATTLSNTVKGIATSAYTTIKELNNDIDRNGRNWFQRTGKSLGDALASVFSDRDLFNAATKALSDLIGDENKGVLGGIQSAINSMAAKDKITGLNSWETMGQKVADGVSSIFSAKHLSVAASTLSSVFKGILSSIKTTLDDLNNANFFGDIGESLANMLVSAFSKDGLFDRVSRTIGSALTSSLQLLTGFTNSMNQVDYSTGLNGWQTFGQGLANSFNNIFTDDNVSSIVGNLDGMANGIVQSLESSLGSEDVQKKITIMVTSLAQSIAKVMTSDSVVKTLKTAWGTILTTLSDMIESEHPIIAWAFNQAGQSALRSANWDDSWDTEVADLIASTQGHMSYSSAQEIVYQRHMSTDSLSVKTITADAVKANDYAPYTSKAAKVADQASKKSVQVYNGMTSTPFPSTLFEDSSTTTAKKTTTATAGSIATTKALSLTAEVSTDVGKTILSKIQDAIKGKSVKVSTTNTDASSTGKNIYNTLQKTASKNAIAFKSENSTSGSDFLAGLQKNILSANNNLVSVGSKSNGDGKGYINSLNSDILSVNGFWKPQVGAKSNGDGKGYINSLNNDIKGVNSYWKPQVGAESNGDGKGYINSLNNDVKAVNGSWKPQVGAMSNGDGYGYINTLQNDINSTGWKINIPANVTGLGESIKRELQNHLAKFTFTTTSGSKTVNYGAATLQIGASGGLFDEGQAFIAREAGPELVGTIGRKTAVVNNEQIVASVARGVASANDEEVAVLKEQNRILRAILAKDSTVTVSTSQIVNGINRANRRTGTTSI